MRNEYVTPVCKIVCSISGYVLAAESSFESLVDIDVYDDDIAENDDEDSPIWHAKGRTLWNFDD